MYFHLKVFRLSRHVFVFYHILFFEMVSLSVGLKVVLPDLPHTCSCAKLVKYTHTEI